MEHGVDVAALASWMDTKGLGSGPLTDVRSLAGGTQNILLRFNRDGRGYVLRRPPLHLRGNSNKTMQREARMLAALGGTDVPHPRFIASCDDDGVLGASFYLMQPIEGFNATQGLPPYHAGSEAARHRMGLSMVEAVARLGAQDYVALGLEDFGKVDNYLERQVGRWRSQLESYGEHQGWPGPTCLPGVERVASWLADNIPPDFQPGIIHGDYHLANVMFHNDSPELAAIIDWELTTIGDPLLDLGWLMATWPETGTPRADDVAVMPWKGFPAIPELIEHYGKHSRRDLAHIKWYGVLACYKLGIIIEGTHARACAGKAPVATGDKLHAHAVSLFERALRWIG